MNDLPAGPAGAFFLQVFRPADQAMPSTTGRSERDPIQPVAQQLGVANRPSLASQNQKDGLERVLCTMPVTQKLLADAQNHRTMPGDQGGKEAGVSTIAAVVNRSMSWRSESPATQPPLKSDSILGTTDGDATRNISGLP